MINDDPDARLAEALADNELRNAIMAATQRRLERAAEGFDTSAIRSNSIPKKSRRTSIFHRALR